MSVSNITEKWMNVFHFFFMKGRTWDKKQSGTLSDLAVNPLIRCWFFFYFLDPCLLIIFCKNERVSGLSWNFHDMSGTTQEVIISTISCLTRLFHDLQLGTVVCLWATLPLNDWTDFPEIFSLGPLLYVERSGTFGGDMLNPSNTGFFFFYFLGLSL